MEFQRLGNSGLQVSRIIFGAMQISKDPKADWQLNDEEKIMKLLKYAYDKGMRTIDTANVYANGQSEELVGKFLKKYNIKRSTVVILTKCYNRVNDDPDNVDEFKWVNRHGLSRKHVFDAVKDSVRRLGTYIDVLQIHRLDHSTNKTEIMEALHDVVKSGDVRYIGASSMRAVEFAQLQFIAEKNNWTKFVSMQGFYNLLYREEEREMNPYCDDTGVGLIPWSPLAGGSLARSYGDNNTARSKRENYRTVFGPADETITNRVEELANKKSVTMAQIATAWTLAKGCAPILGMGTPARIDEAIASLKIKLTKEELEYLESPYVATKVLGFSPTD
jgi:aryl-alcohol dehydrogenase-like predicted oxidoreductase